MQAALLLVDLQQDFLAREGLYPAAADIVDRCATLLRTCREQNLPVFHCRTRIAADGSDRMPHWSDADTRLCVHDEDGERPPPELAERAGERVTRKQYYSAFDAPELDASLRASRIEVLIVAGIYLHGCVRATVLDAYRRGYRVWVAREATGSTEPLHAEISRDYLHQRAAEFLSTREITLRVGPGRQPLEQAAQAACIDGQWRSAQKDDGGYRHRNPSRQSEVLSEICFAPEALVHEASTSATRASRDWRATGLRERCAVLARWQSVLARQREAFVALMVREVGKPVAAAQEEFGRALKHIEVSLALAADEALIGNGVHVAYRPLGTVALITPWNNPVAIPVAKLAAALVQGNSTVWKPASQSALTARLLMETLEQAGLPRGVCNLVFGDAECVRNLLRQPDIAAVSMTGSEQAGAQVRALCAHYDKPLQAELGGNNAAIVLADADLAATVAALVPAAYSYSGQRCTAIRRLIVEDAILAPFRECWAQAVASLRLGLPDEVTTDIGPLISERQRRRVDRAVTRALEQGARCISGGEVDSAHPEGCWYRPTLLQCASPQAQIVQQETFGPVAVLLGARDPDHAIELANAVPQGLLAAVFCSDTALVDRIADSVHVGILRLAGNIQAIDPEAPFGGWKSSQVGPPEHGLWDRQFFSRPQARYGSAER